MISQTLDRLTERVKKAQASPLAASHVTLIAASKAQSANMLEAAIHAGQRVFGENRVQEACEKWPLLKARYPDIRLHLIGPLQTNKVRQALDLFDAVHTVDRVRLADALVKEMDDLGRQTPCFIQVNTGEEPQKAGVTPRDAATLIAHCRNVGLPLCGLMCIPPAHVHSAAHFALLRKMADEHGLPWLSMGMSEDFETAVRFGATHVRIGRALFGERD